MLHRLQVLQRFQPESHFQTAYPSPTKRQPTERNGVAKLNQFPSFQDALTPMPLAQHHGIALFAAQATRYYQATQQGNARAANRAYTQIIQAKDRLIASGQFTALAPLLHYANPIVQPWAARYLEPVFTIYIGRFYDIKAWIQGKKHSKVEHLARIFNAVAAFLGHKRCL